jgi:hypothetical protein
VAGRFHQPAAELPEEIENIQPERFGFVYSPGDLIFFAQARPIARRKIFRQLAIAFEAAA